METANAQKEVMPLQEINQESQDNKGKFDFVILQILKFYFLSNRKRHSARSAQDH